MAQGAGNGKQREVPLVRIFLSSPGDVAEERKQARELIGSELPNIPSLRGRMALQVIAWDDPAARIPMLATEAPQDSVNASRPRPATCDIVIVILWSRMGTPLPATVRKPGGEPYLSGTEWEYEDALIADPRPDILIYRRTEKPRIDIDDPELVERQAQYGLIKQSVEPAARREELLTRSGLLLPRPNQRASFYHLSFQEFLAAERILRTDDNLEPVFRERGTVPEWRPTLMFLFAGKIASKTPLWGADLLVRLMADPDGAAVKANSAPAVFISEALELCLAKGYRVSEELADGFRRLSLDAIEDEIEVHARHALALCLGRLGDRRIVDQRDPGAYVQVSAGTYPYGEEGETVEIETPFRIGRYPVTNSQYRAFMDDGGYQTRQWWSESGWKWLQQEGATEPEFWGDRRWNGPNQPVVGVSFWEAEACCAWAGGWLPGEQQWEAAARGPDGFVYPWGNDWEDGICNSYEAGLGVTSSVGLFPRSRQRTLGLEDLAGNAFEWCDSPYRESDNVTATAEDRVLRGGSWYYYQDLARSALRFWYYPVNRNDFIGFRVVCSSPSSRTDP